MVEFYFFDSSALIKRYVAETGSSWVQTVTHPQSDKQIVVARITWVEVLSAFSRLRREGSLPPTDVENAIRAFQYDVDTQYQIVELDPTLIETAGQLVQRHPLRAYDSVQLAAALKLHSAFSPIADVALSFISADQRLLTIAQTEGLETIDPTAVA